MPTEDQRRDAANAAQAAHIARMRREVEAQRQYLLQQQHARDMERAQAMRDHREQQEKLIQEDKGRLSKFVSKASDKINENRFGEVQYERIGPNSVIARQMTAGRKPKVMHERVVTGGPGTSIAEVEDQARLEIMKERFGRGLAQRQQAEGGRQRGVRTSKDASQPIAGARPTPGRTGGYQDGTRAAQDDRDSTRNLLKWAGTHRGEVEKHMDGRRMKDVSPKALKAMLAIVKEVRDADGSELSPRAKDVVKDSIGTIDTTPGTPAQERTAAREEAGRAPDERTAAEEGRAPREGTERTHVDRNRNAAEVARNARGQRRGGLSRSGGGGSRGL